VSHDRYFIDRVATHIVAIEPEGRVREYPGNYSDYIAKRSAAKDVALSGAKK
jgi:ATP-binding cassette subfamily F protein uup